MTHPLYNAWKAYYDAKNLRDTMRPQSPYYEMACELVFTRMAAYQELLEAYK